MAAEEVGGPAAAVDAEGDLVLEEEAGDGLLPEGDDELFGEGGEREGRLGDAEVGADGVEIGKEVGPGVKGVGVEFGGDAFPGEAVGGELFDAGWEGDGGGVSEEGEMGGEAGGMGGGVGRGGWEGSGGGGNGGDEAVFGRPAGGLGDGEERGVSEDEAVGSGCCSGGRDEGGGDDGNEGEARGQQALGDVAEAVDKEDGVSGAGEVEEGQGRGQQGVVVVPGEDRLAWGRGEEGDEVFGGIVPGAVSAGGGDDPAAERA
jgi:hypothetical protein